MASIASIAINDGKATPATHTFAPQTAGRDASYRTNDTTLPLVGQEWIRTTVKRVSPSLNEVQVVLELPALETATGANSSGYTAAAKVAYAVKAKMVFFLPERSTPDHRKDLRVLVSNLLANAQIIDLIDNLTPNH